MRNPRRLTVLGILVVVFAALAMPVSTAKPSASSSDPWVGAWTEVEKLTLHPDTAGRWFIFYEEKVGTARPVTGYTLDQCGPEGTFGAFMSGISWTQPHQTANQEEFLTSEICDDESGDVIFDLPEFFMEFREDGNLYLQAGPNSDLPFVPVTTIQDKDITDKDRRGISNITDVHAARQYFLDLATAKLAGMPGTYVNGVRSVVIGTAGQITYTNTAACPGGGVWATTGAHSLGIQGITPYATAEGVWTCGGVSEPPDTLTFYYHLVDGFVSGWDGLRLYR